jgi:cobalt-zinc-cadmium efflux system outer membrane protein
LLTGLLVLWAFVPSNVVALDATALDATALDATALDATALDADQDAATQRAAVPADTLRLDLAEARRIALDTSPLVRQALAGVNAARGARRQARTYAFNPLVEVKAPSLVDPGDASPFEGLVTQEIEWAGQWGLRRTEASHRLAGAEAVLRDTRRTIGVDVDIAYLRVTAAQNRIAVLFRAEEIANNLLNAVSVSFDEGQLSRLDLNLARISAGRARAEATGGRRDVSTATMELARTLGLAPETPLTLDTVDLADHGLSQMTLTALVDRALSARPDIDVSAEMLDAAATLQRLVARQAIPNLRLSAVATRSAAGEPVRWGLRFGIPVPLWNRNVGASRQAIAEESRARAAYDETRLAVRTEVATAFANYVGAREQRRIYTEDVLAPARENSALLGTAFDEGQINLTTTLLLQTQLQQAELGYWDAWLREQEALARLQGAVGMEMPD